MRSTYGRLVGEDLATHLTTIDIDVAAAAKCQHMLSVCEVYVTHTPVLRALMTRPTLGAATYAQHKLDVWPVYLLPMFCAGVTLGYAVQNRFSIC